MMTLNNPQLAPPIRMQLSMQAQMLNANLQQMQMMATSTMGMGMQGMNGGGGGGGGGMQANGQMQASLHNAGYRNGIPTGPAAGRRGGGPVNQQQQRQQGGQHRPAPYDRTAASARGGRGVPTAPANRNARY